MNLVFIANILSTAVTVLLSVAALVSMTAPVAKVLAPTRALHGPQKLPETNAITALKSTGGKAK